MLWISMKCSPFRIFAISPHTTTTHFSTLRDVSAHIYTWEQRMWESGRGWVNTEGWSVMKKLWIASIQPSSLGVCLDSYDIKCLSINERREREKEKFFISLLLNVFFFPLSLARSLSTTTFLATWGKLFHFGKRKKRERKIFHPAMTVSREWYVRERHRRENNTNNNKLLWGHWKFLTTMIR